MERPYPKEFFNLIISYATKRSRILNIPLLQSIQEATPIYYLIGNYNWEFKETSPFWQTFKNRLQNGEQPEKIAFEMYKENYKDESLDQKWFGCFRYNIKKDSKTGEQILRIHFRNADTTGAGPLSSTQEDLRLKELRELFTEVKNTQPQIQRVRGGSWLYHYDSYKSLFPKSYISNLKALKPQTGYSIIWGQFINSEGELDSQRANDFSAKLDAAESEEDLASVFPYKEYVSEGDIQDFYSLYEIS